MTWWWLGKRWGGRAAYAVVVLRISRDEAKGNFWSGNRYSTVRSNSGPDKINGAAVLAGRRLRRGCSDGKVDRAAESCCQSVHGQVPAPSAATLLNLPYSAIISALMQASLGQRPL